MSRDSTHGESEATSSVTPDADRTQIRGDTAPLTLRPRLSRAERLALERERLLGALASGETEKLHERVAWILSRQPHTRNSDIALQLEYWKEYEPELYESLETDSKVLYQLTRLTSIARARAKIQNTFRLFQASAEIRKRRGRMSEEERERYATVTPPSSVLTVYADESGKTDAHLIVGSVWFLDPADTIRLVNRIQAWRTAIRFEGEFHFAELSPRTLPIYKDLIELVISEAPLLSFKSISVPRQGIRHTEMAFDVLFYELLRRGIQHEHETGRAELPRRILLWKDKEEEGKDRLMLARLKEALVTASSNHFEGRLGVEECEALDSKGQPLLQLADLYTGSINRTLSRAATSDKPKDTFTDFLLNRVQSLAGAEADHALPSGELGELDIHLRV